MEDQRGVERVGLEMESLVLKGKYQACGCSVTTLYTGHQSHLTSTVHQTHPYIFKEKDNERVQKVGLQSQVKTFRMIQLKGEKTEEQLNVHFLFAVCLFVLQFVPCLKQTQC